MDDRVCLHTSVPVQPRPGHRSFVYSQHMTKSNNEIHIRQAGVTNMNRGEGNAIARLSGARTGIFQRDRKGASGLRAFHRNLSESDSFLRHSRALSQRFSPFGHNMRAIFFGFFLFLCFS